MWISDPHNPEISAQFSSDFSALTRLKLCFFFIPTGNHAHKLIIQSFASMMQLLRLISSAIHNNSSDQPRLPHHPILDLKFISLCG